MALPLILAQAPSLPPPVVTPPPVRSGFEILHEQVPTRIFPRGTTSACENLVSGLLEGKFSPITCIVQQVDLIAREVMYNGLTTITNALKVPLTAAATLAIIFLGYTLIAGRAESAYDPIKKILMICLAVTFVTTFPRWGLPVAEDIVIHIPPEIGALIYNKKSRTEIAIEDSMDDYDTLAGSGYSRQGALDAADALPSLNMRIPLMLDAFLLDGIGYAIAVVANMGMGKTVGAILGSFGGISSALRNSVGLKGCGTNAEQKVPPKAEENDQGFLRKMWGFVATPVAGVTAGISAGIAQFVMAAVSITAGLIVLVMVLYWVLSTTMMYLSNYLRGVLMITLAPIFGLFFLFEKTRDIAQKWLQSLISTALLFLLMSATISMFAAIMDTTLSSLGNPANCSYSPIVFVLVILILYMILTQMTKNLPTITQELTGSSGQSSIDVVGQSLSLVMQTAKVGTAVAGFGMLTNTGLGGKASEVVGSITNRMTPGGTGGDKTP